MHPRAQEGGMYTLKYTYLYWLYTLYIIRQQFGDICHLEGVWAQRGGMYISLYLCICIPSSSCSITQKIITNTLEPNAFQKYSIQWSLLAFHNLIICVFVFSKYSMQ